ncbi:sensor domain-containing diguanylate cyclase [Buttiauxella massiliensis]|uniref:sensor domain-containing diguanylate cyclase n=1 Tax=Buttiauxella massiliensis TaxID=2831590 RepID=UPI00186A1759|nr:sensor domain-containing diguanylate cyclase [Buttiauxella massiliensis]
MKNTISHKHILLFTVSTFIPFFIMFFYTFTSMESRNKEDLIQTMTRFNENSSKSAIERPIQEMRLLFQSILGQLSRQDISNYISPLHSELNSIIPSIVNSTTFFETVILSDKNGNYLVYPETKARKFSVKQRPWYPSSSRKDEVRFSSPYKSLSDNNHYNGMAITASMNIFNEKSEFVGNIAFDLDLNSLSQLLKGSHPPYNSRFKVVSYDGSLIMYSNTKELFKRPIPQEWIDMAKESEGHFFDSVTRAFVFYRVYDNPEWIAFSIVSESDYEAHSASEKYSFILVSAACVILYLIIMFISKLYFRQIITALYLNLNGISLDNDSIKKVTETLADNSKKLELAIHEAETDGLTNLFSRKKLNSDMHNILLSKHPFYLAIIDVDNFKSVNDSFGHHTGDIVLKYISNIGSEILSQVYRFGGEELVAIFEGSNYDAFYTLLDLWRKSVEEKQWRENGLNVTFSCGVSSWNEGSNPDEILEKADSRLYQAKNSGKNCIVGPE